jgi:hypothetical protein
VPTPPVSRQIRTPSFVGKFLRNLASVKHGRFIQTLDCFHSLTRFQTTLLLIPNYTTVTRNSKKMNPILNRNSLYRELMTLCANLTPIKRPGCPSNSRSLYQSYTPSNSSRTKPKWLKPQPERQWRTLQERKIYLDQVPLKKLTRSHQYGIITHSKEVMLQFYIAISSWRDIPPDISDQIPPEVPYCQKEPVKLENLPLPS